MKPITDRPTLQLASRIDARLQRAFGESIDVPRLLVDALYRRDVLLVCDAVAPGDLPLLAQELRGALARLAQASAAAAAAADQSAAHKHRPRKALSQPPGGVSGNTPGGAPARPMPQPQALKLARTPADSAQNGPDSMGFSPSRFLNALFGAWSSAGDVGARHQTKARQRGWFRR